LNFIGFQINKMKITESLLKTPERDERVFLERELNKLMETTFKMEHELGVLLKEAKAEGDKKLRKKQ